MDTLKFVLVSAYKVSFGIVTGFMLGVVLFMVWDRSHPLPPGVPPGEEPLGQGVLLILLSLSALQHSVPAQALCGPLKAKAAGTKDWLAPPLGGLTIKAPVPVQVQAGG